MFPRKIYVQLLMRFGGVISVDLCQQSNVSKLFPNLLAEVIEIFLKGQFTGSLGGRERDIPVHQSPLENCLTFKYFFYLLCFELFYHSLSVCMEKNSIPYGIISCGKFMKKHFGNIVIFLSLMSYSRRVFHTAKRSRRRCSLPARMMSHKLWTVGKILQYCL